MDDAYSGLADRYDLFFESFAERDPAEVTFYRSLLARQNACRVLDCACGTGRDLYLFHTLGCEVVGADLSKAMLDRARENLAREGVQLPLVHADYCALHTHWDAAFDVVTCLSSSLLHMPDPAQALMALRSMRAVLRQGGLLVLTQGTTDRQMRERPRFLLARNSPTFSRTFAIDYHGRGATYHILDIFCSADRQGLEVWSTEYPHILLQADYAKLLPEAGFGDIEFLGAYDGAPYDPVLSRRLIVLARAI